MYSGRRKMETNGTASDNGENATNEAANSTETERDTQGTQSSTSADPMGAMQAALASFDGLRVDAAIQVE